MRLSAHNSLSAATRAMMAALAATTTLLGCGYQMRNRQIENVAKDWSLVIRASQVIPVYPLTEDIQPGDILLVSTPVEEQARLYKTKGFLPLDQLLYRFHSADFRTFYNLDSSAEMSIPPPYWSKERRHNALAAAPHAAFPSYQFSVDSGTGANLALPIKGVPFAMNLMNAKKASGSVTIGNTLTYGLDNLRLNDMVTDTWAKKYRGLLRQYEPQGNYKHYLRVVSRVYLTTDISVTINNDESTSAGAVAGSSSPIELLGLGEGTTGDNYEAAIKRLNNLTAEALPGGSIAFAAASSRSVTLNEKFDEPLVIGYLGFDLPILEGGRLGAPISTLEQLTSPRTGYHEQVPASAHRLAVMSHMYQVLVASADADARHLRSALDSLAGKLLPSSYGYTAYELDASGDRTRLKVVEGSEYGQPVRRQTFEDVLEYVSFAESSAARLETELNGGPASTDSRSALTTDLVRAKSAAEAIRKSLFREPVVVDAVDFLLYGN
jgi:hypothetical protein